MSVLEDLHQSVRSVVERAGPSIVGIGGGWRGGSGVVIADGSVLTNAHVVRRGDPTLRLTDGATAAATVAASDVDTDLAVLRADGLPAGLPWRPDNEPVELGLPVFALAATRGGGLHASFGLVSSTGRSFRGARGRRVTGTVEHTAPLPRGSSGSALVDAQGRLVGINTLRLDGGLILAVAADAAIRERVEALGRGESPTRIVLGVGLAPARVARRLRAAVGLPPRDGLLVRQVEPDSPAAVAGVQPGDLIVAAAGREATRVDALYEALDQAGPGGSLALTVLRGVEEHALEVQLTTAPGSDE
jgi:serine protease Do